MIAPRVVCIRIMSSEEPKESTHDDNLSFLAYIPISLLGGVLVAIILGCVFVCLLWHRQTHHIETHGPMCPFNIYMASDSTKQIQLVSFPQKRRRGNV